MSLDWDGAHARLRAAQERLDAIDQSVGDFEARLQARAAAIAAAHAAPERTGVTDYVEFSVGGRRYAVDARAIDTVVAIGAVTPLPNVPPMYRGLVTHRGVVYPLLDIGPLLGEPAAAGAFAQALLFANGAATLAIGADAVETLRAVEAADVERGTTAGGVVLLDLERVSGDARLIVDG